MTYVKHIPNRNVTPQSQPLPGQVANSAGGYTWAVDDWKRLDRFLILGSENGSFYASERTLTLENASAVQRCIQADGLRVVKRIVEISEAGRAPKNDPAIFALAMACSQGDPATRRAVTEALPKVCRIGTFLFKFAACVDKMRGWGRGLRRAIAAWYTNADAEDIAFQGVKYQQRDGWSHRDMLRLAHPVAPTAEHNLVFNWMAKGWPGVGEEPHPTKAAQIIWAFERAKHADKAELLKLITHYRLPREAVPTQWLTDADIWAAMLPHLGLTALIRNLGNLSKCGLLSPGNLEVVREVTERITSADGLRKARIHPVAILAALLTYKQGRGVRSDGVWTVVPQVVDALDAAFYKAFGNVEPSGQRLCLALDVSGSMGGGMIAGVPGLTPRIGSAALALITAATEIENAYNIIAFGHKMVHIDISPRQRLDDVVRAVSNLEFGGTDCALPMLWALENRVKADAFIVLTDSESWFGSVHPSQALQQYRDKTGIPAKLIVCGLVSNGFTIADPNDAGMLDVVGFDTATPQVISDFAAGR